MIIIDNLRAFDIIKVRPRLYRIVAASETGPHTWCAFESYTRYKPTLQDAADSLHIGRPLSYHEAQAMFASADDYQRFSKPLGIYWNSPDKILLTA